MEPIDLAIVGGLLISAQVFLITEKAGLAERIVICALVYVTFLFVGVYFQAYSECV